MEQIPLNDSLAFNISRSGTLLRRHLTRTLSKYKVTPEQWQIIVILFQSEIPVNQKAIADHLMKDKHAVSRMIKRLENNDWVKKQPHEKDNRVTLIALTDKGNDKAQQMYDTLAYEVRSHVFNQFSQAEKDQVKTFLKKLRAILGDPHPGL